MNPVLRWVCHECGDDHDDEDDARWCCAPRIGKQWLCSECHTLHDEEREATDCCAADAVAADPFHPLASPAEREAAGQQRLPM